jgi:hypothetical protein
MEGNGKAKGHAAKDIDRGAGEFIGRCREVSWN